MSINPKDADLINGRAVAYLRKGTYDKAIEDYNLLLKLNPNNIEGYFRREIAYKEIKNYDKTIADFRKVLEPNPNKNMLKNSYKNRMNKNEKVLLM